jgi:hypothetical protein
MSVFWVVAPCRLVWVYQRFRGWYCLRHTNFESKSLMKGSDKLWDTGIDWRIILKWMCKFGLDSRVQEEGLVEVSYERRNESLGSIKCNSVVHPYAHDLRALNSCFIAFYCCIRHILYPTTYDLHGENFFCSRKVGFMSPTQNTLY